jgi:Uma2 family endonuclease
VATVVMDEGTLNIPPWVTDFQSFRRWVTSDGFPEKGKIWFIRGNVWADMCKEQLFWHNQVKLEIGRVLGTLVREEKKGRFFGDGLRLTNLEAEFSGVPDGTYVTFDALRSNRAKYVAGADDGYTELEGAPDLVIEVMSDSSEDKDTEWLQKTYWEAGISEYWLIDVRRGAHLFRVYQHSKRGCTQIKATKGWTRSRALDHSFRLIQQVNGMGHPDYLLEVR